MLLSAFPGATRGWSVALRNSIAFNPCPAAAVMSALRSIREQAHAVAIEPEQFDEAAAFTATCKQRDVARIFFR
jgi:hypothetical protein